MQKRLAAAAAAGLLFAALAPEARARKDKSDVSEFNFEALKADPAKVADEFVNVANKRYAKGAKKVFISSFKVEFVTGEGTGAKSAGWTNLAGGAGIGADLAGVDSAAFQAITDKLYDDYVAALKASGLEVLAKEQFAANETVKGFTAETTPVKEEFGGKKSPSKGETLLFSATGVPFIWGPMDTTASGGHTSMKVTMKMPKVAQTLDATELGVILTVHFANFAHSNWLLAGSKSEASFTPAIVVNGCLRVSAAMFDVQPDSPVAIKDSFATTEKNAAKSGRSIGHYTVKADPAAYQAAVLKAAGAVREMQFAKLKEHLN